MPLVAARRRAFSALTALSVAAVLAGCGGDDGAGSGSAGGSSDASDAKALLRDGFLRVTKDGQPITSGAFAMKLSGTLDAPKDKDVKAVKGVVSLTAAVDKGADGASLPPFTLKVNVDGTYTDGNGKSGEGKYDAGATFIDDAFYASWAGKNYAVGGELSKQLIAEIDKLNTSGAASGGTTPGKSGGLYGGVDPQKVVDAMKLDPDTWFKDPKVEDGGEIDGVKTLKVSGAVDPKIVADDVTEGLRNLPAAVPELPGVKELAKVSDASGDDIKKLEEAITKLDAAVWVGEEDHLQRKMKLDIGVDTQDGGDPIKADLSIEAVSTDLNEPQKIVAPTGAEPITDLFLILEKEFKGLFPTGPTAAGTTSG